mgnify:CR=1 FL=1
MLNEILTQQTQQINTYLSLVYPSKNSYVALCLIPSDNQPVEHRFTTVANLPKFLPYVRFRNAHGWNVYITPSVLKPHTQNRRKESFLPHQSIIYVDCDDQSCLEEIKACYPYPTLVVRTSKGRYQCYWRLVEPVAVTEQENLMRSIAHDIDSDPQATDVSRVLRLPGFWNRKENRGNTVDVAFTRNHSVSYQLLTEHLQPIPLTTSTPGGRLCGACEYSSHQQPSVRGSYSCSSSRPDHSKSGVDWYLVNHWLGTGVSREECIQRLVARRADKCHADRYAIYTVGKAIKIRLGG